MFLGVEVFYLTRGAVKGGRTGSGDKLPWALKNVFFCSFYFCLVKKGWGVRLATDIGGKMARGTTSVLEYNLYLQFFFFASEDTAACS